MGSLTEQQENSTQVIVYVAQGYSASILKAGHLVSCLCVRVRVRVRGEGCGGGGGGGVVWALGFSYAIHMYIRGKD